MKAKLVLITLLLCWLASGCTFVGNSPMERRHREALPEHSNG